MRNRIEVIQCMSVSTEDYPREGRVPNPPIELDRHFGWRAESSLDGDRNRTAGSEDSDPPSPRSALSYAGHSALYACAERRPGFDFGRAHVTTHPSRGYSLKE